MHLGPHWPHSSSCIRIKHLTTILQNWKRSTAFFFAKLKKSHKNAFWKIHRDNDHFVIVVRGDTSVYLSQASLGGWILSMQSLGRRWMDRVHLVKKSLTLHPVIVSGHRFVLTPKSPKGILHLTTFGQIGSKVREKFMFTHCNCWKYKLPVNFQFVLEFFESWMLFDNFTCCLFVTQWPLRKGDNSGYGTNWKSPSPLQTRLQLLLKW